MVAYLAKQTAALCTIKDGVMGITTTIHRKDKVVTEASIRRHLKLEDSDGINTLPTASIFEQLTLMGFIQIFLNKHKRLLLPYKRTFFTPTLTQKLFSNMKRASKGYSGVITPLFDTMLVQHQGEEPSIQTTPESSPSRITSSPSLSPYHTPISAPSISQLPSIQTTPVAEEAAPMPHESPLQSVHSLGRDKGSLSLNKLTVLYISLSKKVAGLESETIKTSKARRKSKVVLFDKEDEEDSSKQGRSLIEELDLNAGISLVPPHAADQGRFDDTQVSDQPEELLGIFSATTALADAARRRRSAKNVTHYTRRKRTISTASGDISIAGASEPVSTAGVV
ncbi:hypothetical protein Tco_0787214 [Tanacetum coccineum]